MTKNLQICWAILWASPASVVGLTFGSFAMVTGGSGRRVGRVLEFHGGVLDRLLKKVPIAGGASAMTLGHCVIARTSADLDRCRLHELVHVRQYERWGPLFIPAYFASSAWQWLNGRDAYRDNAFEIEAYQCEGAD